MTALQTAKDREVRMVGFRAPSRLIAAMERAAGHDFISVSDFIRTAVSKQLRVRGALEDIA